MKGRLTSFIRGSLLAHALLLCHGIAMAFGISSTTLEVSTVILPAPAPAIVQTLNAKKEVLAVYEMDPSNAMEKVHVISMMEETKGVSGKTKTILVTFN